MKLNLSKSIHLYSANIDGVTYRFGWYDSGKAFIAKEDELMTFAQAYKTLVLKNCYTLCDAFFIGVTKYKKTLDGIVRYLIDKYKKS